MRSQSESSLSLSFVKDSKAVFEGRDLVIKWRSSFAQSPFRRRQRRFFQSRIHLLVLKSEVKGSSLRGFVKFREWKIRRYACLLLLSHSGLLLSLLVVWHFLRQVRLVQICLPQSLFLSLLWKIELFLKFCLKIKTLLALFFNIMLAFLSVMRR